jgi:uncharacterized membrane protein
MGKGRLEAFSDGVLAIIITIMVLELRPPHGYSLQVLKPLLPTFMCYTLSFIYIGIYWNNHHHLLHTVKKVNGRILWANAHLLFWLSLIPFVTVWMGENHFSLWPVVMYGVILIMCGIAYYMLVAFLIALHGKASLIAQAIGRDKKGIASVLIYALGIGLCFLNPWLGMGCYVVVAIIWFIPDTRIERILYKAERGEESGIDV